MTVPFRTRLEEGKFDCAVGPFAFGGCPAAPFADPRLNVKAVEWPAALSCFAAIPSIIFIVFSSPPASVPAASGAVLGFFLRAPAALACAAAKRGGNSWTCAYSARILEAIERCSAVWKQDVSSWELSAKRARERFAFWEMRFVRYSVCGVVSGEVDGGGEATVREVEVAIVVVWW